MNYEIKQLKTKKETKKEPVKKETKNKINVKEIEATLKEKKKDEEKAKIKKFKNLVKEIDLANFIGNTEYGTGFKLKQLSSENAAKVALLIEQNVQKWQSQAITYYNDLRTTTPYNNGVYFEVIPNYKALEEFKLFLDNDDNFISALKCWLAFLKTLTSKCWDFLYDMLTSLDKLEGYNYYEEFKKFNYYIPKIKHNSLSICLPVLPCYINIQYTYFKGEKDAFKHWCINYGVTLFLEALLENPYNYKELYFKHITGMTSTTSWDAKAYKIINKALYREKDLLLKYPRFYVDKLNLDFVCQLLIFDILVKLQLKILLNLSKNKSIVCVGNVLSFVSDKRVSVDFNTVKQVNKQRENEDSYHH